MTHAQLSSGILMRQMTSVVGAVLKAVPTRICVVCFMEPGTPGWHVLEGGGSFKHVCSFGKPFYKMALGKPAGLGVVSGKPFPRLCVSTSYVWLSLGTLKLHVSWAAF